MERHAGGAAHHRNTTFANSREPAAATQVILPAGALTLTLPPWGGSGVCFTNTGCGDRIGAHYAEAVGKDPVGRMRFPRYRKTNNRAVLGFMLPFLAMGIASGFVLWDRAHGLPVPVWVPLLTLVPVLLIVGLLLSIKSIPLVQELGDKDYAYSGLVLNGFLILFLLVSILYYTLRVTD